jgi:hypothetical protein
VIPEINDLLTLPASHLQYRRHTTPCLSLPFHVLHTAQRCSVRNKTGQIEEKGSQRNGLLLMRICPQAFCPASNRKSTLQLSRYITTIWASVPSYPGKQETFAAKPLEGTVPRRSKTRQSADDRVARKYDNRSLTSHALIHIPYVSHGAVARQPAFIVAPFHRCQLSNGRGAAST